MSKKNCYPFCPLAKPWTEENDSWSDDLKTAAIGKFVDEIRPNKNLGSAGARTRQIDVEWS